MKKRVFLFPVLAIILAVASAFASQPVEREVPLSQFFEKAYPLATCIPSDCGLGMSKVCTGAIYYESSGSTQCGNVVSLTRN